MILGWERFRTRARVRVIRVRAGVTRVSLTEVSVTTIARVEVKKSKASLDLRCCEVKEEEMQGNYLHNHAGRGQR